MHRVPEHDLMDDRAQAQAYASTDFSEPHDMFIERFGNCFPDFQGESALDIGCGTADVTIRFAKRYPESIITGIDGAEAMLGIGRHEIIANALTGRVKLIKCILPDNDLLKQKFDAVISNSLLHHLKDPFVLWDIAKHCSRQNTPVFIMDLFRPADNRAARELVKRHAGNAPDILKKDFYNSLLASYNKEEVASQLNTAGISFLTVETISDRHIVVWGLNE